MSALRPQLLSICLLSASLPTALLAAETESSQRQLFVTLNQQLADQPPQAEQLEQLKAYPLYPYLEYRLLRNNLSSTPAEQVHAFLEHNRDTPLYGRLLFAWAKLQGENGNWQEFIPAWSSITRPDTELQCLHARFLLSNEQQADAWDAARSLWSVGYSQPNVCDAVFTPWLASDNFRSEDALQRHLAALENGRPSLASYVERFLTTDQHKQEAALAKRLYSAPEDLWKDASLLSPKQTHNGRLLEMSVRRLARKDLNTAIQLWIRERDRMDVAQGDADALSEYLGVWLSKRFPAKGQRTLLSQLDPEYRLARLTEWRIRLLLVDQNWQQAHDLIQRLPEELQQDDRWLYWKAIAGNHLGLPNSQATLNQLTGERSFYGFMAAQILNQGYQLNDTPHAPPAEALSAVAAQPAFQRIHELLALERYGDARSEWNLAIKGMTADQVMTASHLMQQWGWHHQGIRGAISSKRWDDMELRFPKPHLDLFQRHAQAQNIDPYWALAVTRQESAFWKGARSHVGARGLMQLMPATAKATARRHGIALPNLDRLSTPDVNIQLGTAYLGEMAMQFDNNQAYASAAYNAGPHRVTRWLKQRGELPLDVWIETIPFDETRQYVQNVLTFRVIYKTRSEQQVALFSQQEFSQLALNR